MKIKPPLPTATRTHARALRTTMTDAERAVWRCLRSKQLHGLKFRRQHPIPPYIADFCCIERRLIIELDGSQHDASSDQARSGSTPFSRTLTRRPIKAMRSVHVKAQEVHCRVQAWRG
ncbi:endonuclease domain-containing protein [Xanthomonas citri pv. bilvae]|uniref:endonuclease domain-containing protein n=1 Tax=Xanthomonas citri TaxID=346 RepID=UPI00406AA3DF